MREPLYSVEREYHVPIDVLWNAWVDADALQQWYSPVGMPVVAGSVVSDAREGGWWTVAVDASAHGWIAYFYGTYTEVIANERLVHTMSYTQDATEFAARDLTAPHHIVEVDFDARGESSWVRFAQFGEMPEGQAEMAKAGMESYFDSLQAHLGLL